MVYDFNIQTRDSTAQGVGSLPDSTVELDNLLGLVTGNNDTLGFGAFSVLDDFYFTGNDNLLTRRYSTRFLVETELNVLGAYYYGGSNAATILAYRDGSVAVWRAGFVSKQTFPAKTLRYNALNNPFCSFETYGASVFLATGAGLYEFDFSSGGNATLEETTCWIADYAISLGLGVNLNLVAVGDTLICTPPAGTTPSTVSILQVRGILKPADAEGNIGLWVTGDGLRTVTEESTIAVAGKATVTAVIRKPAGRVSFTETASLRPSAAQTYGLPVAIANWFSTLVIATTKNYLGGSAPGVPENWNLTAGGAFFAPILARTNQQPTQLLSFQEGLFVGMSNPADPSDGQLFLYNDNDFIEVLNDVGPLPGTMVPLVQDLYFLSGIGIHVARITNVRKQIGTKTVSGPIRTFFQKDRILESRPTWSAYDELTSQIWYGFETRTGPKFLNMDPQITIGTSNEFNRFSFYQNLKVPVVCTSKDGPYLWVADKDTPVQKGSLVQLGGTGGFDLYRGTRKIKISERFVSGPVRLTTTRSGLGYMKDVYIAASNFQLSQIAISVLVDSKEIGQKLSTVTLKGKPSRKNYVDPKVISPLVIQGGESRLFEANPWHQHRGQRFRIVLEGTGANTPWELISLVPRGLSGAHRKPAGSL
jgi:hypothetical protein